MEHSSNTSNSTSFSITTLKQKQLEQRTKWNRIVPNVIEKIFDDGHVPETIRSYNNLKTTILLKNRRTSSSNNNNNSVGNNQDGHIDDNVNKSTSTATTTIGSTETTTTITNVSDTTTTTKTDGSNCIMMELPTMEQILRLYPQYHHDDEKDHHHDNDKNQPTNQVRVIDHAVPTELCEAIYKYTIQHCCCPVGDRRTSTSSGSNNKIYTNDTIHIDKKQVKDKGTRKPLSPPPPPPLPPAWGSYVTINQIQDLWKMKKQQEPNDKLKQQQQKEEESNVEEEIQKQQEDHKKQEQEQQQQEPQYQSTHYNIDDPNELALHVASHFLQNSMLLVPSTKQQQQQQQQQQQHDPIVSQVYIQQPPNQQQYVQQNGTNGINEKDSDVSLWPNPNTNHHQTSDDNSYKNDIWKDVHGIAIWVLPSKINSSVPYHMDYAELIRYEYGVIVPPIVGGTLHCTPSSIATISGGDYYVNLNGLHHYEQYGYKNNKKNVTNTTTTATNNKKNSSNNNGKSQSETIQNVGGDTTMDEFTQKHNDCSSSSSSWVHVPYQYNRMICQSGHLPHYSTMVEAILPTTTTNKVMSPNLSNGQQQEQKQQQNQSNDDTDEHMLHSSCRHYRRVIVGFNIFCHDVGPYIQLAPEHSDSFRQRVQYLRNQIHTTISTTTSNTPTTTLTTNMSTIDDDAIVNCDKNNITTTITSKSKNKQFTLALIQSNPRLARMLVLAKRNKIKIEYEMAVKELHENIQQYLNENKMMINQKSKRVTTTKTTTNDSNPVVNHQKVYDDDDDHHDWYMTEQNIVHLFSRSDGTWPNRVDVEVYFRNHFYDKQRKERYGTNK